MTSSTSEVDAHATNQGLTPYQVSHSKWPHFKKR